MAGTTVDYIIRLLRDDSEFRKQLEKSEKDITHLNAHERAEVKRTLEARISALEASAKAAKRSHESGSMVDTSALKDEMAFIKEVFTEMKSLNPAEDWAKSGKTFAQTFSNMHQQLSDLAKDITDLTGSLTALTTSFQNAGFEIVPKVDMAGAKQATKTIEDLSVGMAKVGQVGTAALNKQAESVVRLRAEMKKLSSEEYELKISDDKLEGRFKQLYKKEQQLYEKIDPEVTPDPKKLEGFKQQYASVVREIIAIEKRYLSLHNKSLLGSDNVWGSQPGQDFYKDFMSEWEAAIKDGIESFKAAIKSAEEELQNLTSEDLGKRIAEQLRGLEIPLTLSPDAEARLIKKINAIVDNINTTNAVKTVKVKLDEELSPIEPEKTSSVGRPASSLAKKRNERKAELQTEYDNLKSQLEAAKQVQEAAESALSKYQQEHFDKAPDSNKHLVGDVAKAKQSVQQLEDLLSTYQFLIHNFDDPGIAKVIDDAWKYIETMGKGIKAGQHRILEATKQWRQQMIEQMKLDGALEFDFGGSLISSLNNYMQQPGHEIKVSLDFDHMAGQLGEFAQNSNINVNNAGSSVSINAESIAAAVAQAMHSVFTGAPMPVNVVKDSSKAAESQSEAPTSSVEDTPVATVAEVAKKLEGIMLTSETIGIDDVIKALKDFVKAPKRTRESKGWNEVANWLTGKGIDIRSINDDTSADTIVPMLQKALMTLDRFGYASGATFKESLTTDIKRFGVQKDSWTHKMMQSMANAVSNMFGYLDLPEDYMNEARLRQERMQSYEHAAKYGRGLEYLNTVRRGVKPGEIGEDTANTLTSEKYLESLDRLINHLTSVDDDGNRLLSNVSQTDIDLLTAFRADLQALQGLPVNEIIAKLQDLLVNRVYHDGSTVGPDGKPADLHGIHEATKALYKVLIDSYSPYEHRYDTFQGRVQLKNGRTKDIDSTRDFIGINDDEIADIWIDRDLMMNRSRSTSVKKSVPQDRERPEYYRARPVERLDVRNANIEVVNFEDIDSDLKHDADYEKKKTAFESQISGGTAEGLEASREQTIKDIDAKIAEADETIAKAQQRLSTETGKENTELQTAQNALTKANEQVSEKTQEYNDSVEQQRKVGFDLSEAQGRLANAEERLAAVTEDAVEARRKEYDNKINTMQSGIFVDIPGDKKKKILPQPSVKTRLEKAREEAQTTAANRAATQANLDAANRALEEKKNQIRDEVIQELINEGRIVDKKDTRGIERNKSVIDSRVTNRLNATAEKQAQDAADRAFRVAKQADDSAQQTVRNFENQINSAEAEIARLRAERDALTVEALRASIRQEIDTLKAQIAEYEKQKERADKDVNEAYKAKQGAEAKQATAQQTRDAKQAVVEELATARRELSEAQKEKEDEILHREAYTNVDDLNARINAERAEVEQTKALLTEITSVPDAKVDTTKLKTLQKQYKEQEKLKRLVDELLKAKDPANEVAALQAQVSRSGFSSFTAEAQANNKDLSAFARAMYSYMAQGSSQMTAGKNLLFRLTNPSEGVTLEQEARNAVNAPMQKITKELSEEATRVQAEIRATVKGLFEEVQRLNAIAQDPNTDSNAVAAALGKIEVILKQIGRLDEEFTTTTEGLTAPRLGAMTKAQHKQYDSRIANILAHPEKTVEANVKARLERQSDNLVSLEAIKNAPQALADLAVEAAEDAKKHLELLEAQESTYQRIIELKLKEAELNKEIYKLRKWGVSDDDERLSSKLNELQQIQSELPYHSPQAREEHALRQATEINAMLKMAYRKKGALEKDDIPGLDSEIKNTRSFKLHSRAGKTAFSALISNATEYFKRSDYLANQTAEERKKIDDKLAEFDKQAQKRIEETKAYKEYDEWLSKRQNEITEQAYLSGVEHDAQVYMQGRLANSDLRAIRNEANYEYTKAGGQYVASGKKQEIADKLAAARQAADEEYEKSLNAYIANYHTVKDEIARRSNEIRTRHTQTADARIEELQNKGEPVDNALVERIRNEANEKANAEITRMQTTVRESFLRSLDDRATADPVARQKRNELEARRQRQYTEARRESQVAKASAIREAEEAAVEKYMASLLEEYYQDAGKSSLSKGARQKMQERRAELMNEFYGSREFFEHKNTFYVQTAEEEDKINKERAELRRALFESLREEASGIIKSFIESITHEKGVVKLKDGTNTEFRSIFRSFLSEYGYTPSGDGQTDLAKTVITNLTAAKKTKEGELKVLLEYIQTLETNLATAYEYGNIDKTHIRNEDLYTNIYNAEREKDDLITKRDEAHQELVDATAEYEKQKKTKKGEALKPYRDAFKAAQKKYNDLENRIIEQEKIIDNSEAQIEQREEALAARVKTAEQQLDGTRQGVARKEARLTKLDQRITELESELASIKDDPEQKAEIKARLTYAKQSRSELQNRLNAQKRREAYLAGVVSKPTPPASVSESTSPVSAPATGSGEVATGGILGLIHSTIENAVSGVKTEVNLNTSDLAKESTLREITDLLGGDYEYEEESPTEGSTNSLQRGDLADDLIRAQQVEEAANTLQNALSKIDLRSGVTALTTAYQNFGKEVFEAEKLLRDPSYEGDLEVARLAAMGLTDFPDVGKLLTKMEKLRGKVGQSLESQPSTISETSDVKTHLFNQFVDWLRQIAKEVFNVTDIPVDKVADAINNIWIPAALKQGKTDISQLNLDRTSAQYFLEDKLIGPPPELKEVIAAMEAAMEAQEAADGLMNIGQAITIINRAIGKSTATTPAGMAKAYANKIHGNDKAVEAAKLLYNTPDSEFTTKFGRDTKKKLLAFHGAWRDAQKPKVEVEPEIKPGAVAEEVKENVAQTPAEAKVEPKATSGEQTQTPEPTREQQLQLILDAINNMGDRISALEGLDDPESQAEKAALHEELQILTSQLTDVAEDVPSEAASSPKTEETTYNTGAPTQKTGARPGGLIKLVSTLAKEHTLQQVVSTLKEIANRQHGIGAPSAAGDLYSQIKALLLGGSIDNHERLAYMNAETGALSGNVIGTIAEIDNDLLKALRKKYSVADGFDTQVHTHGNSTEPYFSEQDYNQFVKDWDAGIKRQVLLTKDNIAVLDLTAVESVEKVDALMKELIKAGNNAEAVKNALKTVNVGAIYESRRFSELNANSLVKMLGVKGIESKHTEAETRDSAVKGMLEEDAKVAADVLQESTGRAIKKTVERVGAELMTTTEKTDAKGNKTWSKQISDKYTKAALATNKAFTNLGLENEFGIGTDAQLALVDYKNKYEEFLRLVEEFKKNPNQDGLQEQFNTLLPQLDAAEDKLNKLIISKDKFLNGKEAIKIFEGADLANAGDSLKNLATARYTKNGLNPGDNIAFNGISETPNGTRLLVDILKDGTIKQYALEVDRATGQVKEFMTAENALANAFQNVNKAMRQNEVVQANVAIGDDPTQQEQFMSTAKSPEWNAYKKALSDMEKYVANIWNRMAQGGRGASQNELDYIMALSEKVLALGKDVQTTSAQFKTFWEQHPEDVTALNIKIKKRGNNVPSRDEQVRAAMEKYAQTNASANGAHYDFASFDNDTLTYKLTDLEGNIRNVTMVWSELYGQAAIMSDKSVAALDPLVAKIQKYDEAIENALSLGYLNGEDPILKSFKEQQAVIESTIAEVKAGTKTYADLELARQKAADDGEAVRRLINKNKKLYVGTNEINSTNRQRDKIIGTLGEANFNKEDIAFVQAYKSAYENLLATHKQFADNHTLYSTKNQEELRQQAVGVQNLGRQLLAAAKQAEDLQRKVDQSGEYIDRRGYVQNLGGVSTPLSTQEAEARNLQETMRSYVANTLKQGNIENVKFNASTQQLTYTFRTSKNTVADMVVQYNAATNALYAYNKQERESLTGFPAFFKGIKAKIGSLWQYTMGITSIHRVLSELRRGVQYIREIDQALTELKKVTNETEKTYDRFLKTAAQTADKVGSTIAEVVNSTADWARLGYNLEEAAHLAESTAILLNVSEFQSIEDATSALTSTLQAFGYTANESMNVVDVLNEVKLLLASLYSDI